MTEISIEAEVLDAILTGKDREKLTKRILEEELSLPLEIVKLGYNYSIYNFDQFGKFKSVSATNITNKRTIWIHILSYCEDKETEDFIEEIFLSEERHKGDCIVALWVRNQKKALKWLKLIHEFDPQFKRILLTSSPLTKKLCSYFSCNKEDLFNMLLFKEHKAKAEIIESSIDKVLRTEAQIREEGKELSGPERGKLGQEIHLIQEERRKLIESGTLKPDQADRLFEALWKSNINLQDPPTSLIERDPTKVFVCHYIEDSGWSYRYHQEISQFLDFIQLVSPKSAEKIKTLYQYLPFWLENYWVIEEAMYKIKSELVLKNWKELILKDYELGKPDRATGFSMPWLRSGKNSRKYKHENGESGRPISRKINWQTRPTPEETIMGLKRLQELKDKEFLLTIMNHYDEYVREEVQKQLKELVQ